MMARLAGSVVNGARSVGRGTSTFPFTFPRTFCCSPESVSQMFLPSGAETSTEYSFSCAGCTGPTWKNRRALKIEFWCFARSAPCHRLSKLRREHATPAKAGYRTPRRNSCVGAEIPELLWRTCKAGILFLQRIVVDKIERHVVIALGFAALRVCFAEKVKILSGRLKMPRVVSAGSFVFGGCGWSASTVRKRGKQDKEKKAQCPLKLWS